MTPAVTPVAHPALKFPKAAVESLVAPNVAPDARFVIVVVPVLRSVITEVRPVTVAASNATEAPVARTRKVSIDEIVAPFRVVGAPTVVKLSVSVPAPPLIESRMVSVEFAGVVASIKAANVSLLLVPVRVSVEVVSVKVVPVELPPTPPSGPVPNEPDEAAVVRRVVIFVALEVVNSADDEKEFAIAAAAAALEPCAAN
jgi:hypothetical protein